MKIKNGTVGLLTLGAGVAAASIAFYVKGNPRATGGLTPPAVVAQPSFPNPTPPIAQPIAPPIKQSQPITVYVPDMGPDGIAFTHYTKDVPATADPKMFAMTQYLDASQIVSRKARLLGIDVKGGVAHLGFNSAFDHGYGSFEEKSLIDGFAATLGQFPDVKSYVMEVDGRQLMTLGNTDLRAPISVIRPADVPVVASKDASNETSQNGEGNSASTQTVP